MTDHEALQKVKEAAEAHARCLRLPAFQGMRQRHEEADEILDAIRQLGEDEHGSTVVAYRP